MASAFLEAIIGAQGHDVYKIGAAKAKTYLDKLASTFNLPIYITEMDIDQSNVERLERASNDGGQFKPPSGKTVTLAELESLRKWIADGAKYP